MSEPAHVLGISFSGNALYYALRPKNETSYLSYIGKADFSFSVLDAFRNADEQLCTHIHRAISKITAGLNAETIRIVSFPQFECWTSLPKLAYDVPAEREAHLKLLAFGLERRNIETTWFETSIQDFRFLCIRDLTMVKMLNACTASFFSTEYCSDFEVGMEWMKLTGNSGSFLALGCGHESLSVSSFVLGKLRAATSIRQTRPENLVYAWRQNEASLSWMNGYHDEILLYGPNADLVRNHLAPVLETGAKIRSISSLDDIGVQAAEQTYSFPLQHAFPAIMMAVKQD
ncbi:MAG: hypothetical protein JJU35_02150 [Balneolales bacterium]|nr:hypothetical protein [Balneolales bacterium]